MLTKNLKEGCKVSGMKAGQKAPAFAVPVVGGGTLTLDSLKGKPSLLVFWKSSCPYCVKEAPGLSKTLKESAGQVVVVAIHVGRDDAKTAAEFAKSHGFTFPIGVDVDKKAREAYGLRIVPTLVWLNQDSTVAGVYEGSSSGLEDAVKKALNALNDGKPLPAYNVVGDG